MPLLLPDFREQLAEDLAIIAALQKRLDALGLSLAAVYLEHVTDEIMIAMDLQGRCLGEPCTSEPN